MRVTRGVFPLCLTYHQGMFKKACSFTRPIRVRQDAPYSGEAARLLTAARKVGPLFGAE